jgi:hypothetical protein
MPKKKRRSALGKRRKKSKASTRSADRQGKTRRPHKRRARTLGNKIKGAYQVVVDTIKGTDQLRNKMEPPATSETE